VQAVATALLAACCAGPLHAADRTYPASGQCGGVARIRVSTPAGWCVGLVASGLRFPRGLLALPGGDLILTEMGGWVPNRGRISILRRERGYAREVVFDAVNLPHGVALGPDNRVYVGVVGGVFRFDPADPAHSRADVIGGTSGVAPLPGSGRHPLVALVFDANHDLFVNVGSASDNCEAEDGTPPDPAKACAEASGPAARGVIRKYSMTWPAGRVAATEVFAQGLRNSAALALHRASNTLLQAENSRDAIHKRDPRLSDEALPHDEINVLRQGRHYGWPYCYDNNLASPEYKGADCAARARPQLLLPAHAAPLGMVVDNDARLPAPFTGHLLVAYHGYRKGGHRLVALRLDANGLPTGKPVDLISGWNAVAAPAAQPMGAPVDVRIGPDGAIWVTEDRNGTLLRLQRE
jgi:glucose/arabinose dehydrogenase